MKTSQTKCVAGVFFLVCVGVCVVTVEKNNDGAFHLATWFLFCLVVNPVFPPSHPGFGLRFQLTATT